MTLAVIWRMMAWISATISASSFSGGGAVPAFASLSVCTSNVHRSRTSPSGVPAMTSTSFCSVPVSSQPSSASSTVAR